MKNEKIYIVKIDYEKNEILDDNFNKVIEGFIAQKVNFSIQLIDINNIIDSHINIIVNKFIQECKMDRNKKPFYAKIENLKSFIINIMKRTSRSHINYSQLFDVITFDKKYSFLISLPENTISNVQYQNLLNLGPDNLVATIPLDVINERILPDFYLHLFHNDLLDNDKYNNLIKYDIGLH